MASGGILSDHEKTLLRTKMTDGSLGVVMGRSVAWVQRHRAALAAEEAAVLAAAEAKLARKAKVRKAKVSKRRGRKPKAGTHPSTLAASQAAKGRTLAVFEPGGFSGVGNGDDRYVAALLARGGLATLSERLTSSGHVACLPLLAYGQAEAAEP